MLWFRIIFKGNVLYPRKDVFDSTEGNGSAKD